MKTGSHSEAPSEKRVAPLRDVMFDSMKRPGGHLYDFRVLTLSCGHHVNRQPAQKVPMRVRCQECAE